MTWLGVVADDFTGASDLAGALVGLGVRTMLSFGLPTGDAGLSFGLPSGDAGLSFGLPSGEADCLVVALKTRDLPAGEAVARSLEAVRWLAEQGAEQIYFKYCSTFDSTTEGNIGPVARALRDELGQPVTLACPATPAIGRTVYRGHLFVGDRLLSESSMRHHPRTPMTDSDLVRLLSAQCGGERVSAIGYETVVRGAPAVRERLAELAAEGVRFAVPDALDDGHLAVLGAAAADHRLVTGATGLARGLAIARGFRTAAATALPATPGHAAIISGSCSAATREQIARFAAAHPAHALGDAQDEEAALDFAGRRLPGGPVLVYALAEPGAVTEERARLVERSLARVARGLVDLGVRKLIVAGGETSGAVVRVLGVESVLVGGQVAPGVPWTVSTGRPRLSLMLKSGNLGGPELFSEAWRHLA